MKRKLGKGKVQGTVLFTVVTVMMVMVVLLMTTLTLTTSAKRRSYYTYFESQAQYASNAAINAVTFSAYSDADFHDWVTNDLSHIGDAGEIHVNFDGSHINFTQGTNNTVTCRIEKINPDVVWDDATNALHPRDMWRITATASVGNGRNVSTASVSQYLYENYQAPARALPTLANNTGNYTMRDVITQPNTNPNPTRNPNYTSPAMLSFGNVGFVNNNITLGPCYSNMATLPLGMFRRSGSTTFYESIDTQNKYFKGEYGETMNGKDPYNLYITNDKMMTVGNCIFVNNVYMRVKMNCEFQSAKEGAVFYGDLNCDNQGIRFVSRISNPTGGDFTDASNYVYVDGLVRITTDAGQMICGDTGSKLPINLYCGGIQTGQNGGRKVSVTGDVYMYNPEVDSTWGTGDGVSPLNKFVGVQVTKVTNMTSYMKDAGGNIVCNNRSLTLAGGNNRFTVPGDIVMTQKDSTLTLNDKVTVSGDIISVGTVALNGATVNGQVITGDNAWALANSGYYNAGYQSSQNKGDYDYRLMPFVSRLDELFQTYYRWDLYSANASDFSLDTSGNLISNDPYIIESQKCGHTWKVKDFNTPGGTYWVPYTTCTMQGYYMIPTHTYYNPSQAIGNIVANGRENILSYAGFIGTSTLPEYSGSTKSIKTVSHDVNGATTSTGNPEITLENYYVVNTSCEIDTSTYQKIFVDPSALQSNEVLKIVLKGDCGGSGGTLDFVVNNTAFYNGNYSNPTAYADNNTFVGNSQVLVFLKEGFGHTNANLYMRTTGILRQWEAKEMSVVQSPTYPDEAGWANLGNDVKYAYELVPNFTVYGQQGATYNFSVSNAACLNADVAMPCSSIRFGTVNSGNRHITYRETCNVTDPSEGTTYVWAVGSFMLDTLDLNDRCAMTAYIGAIGTAPGNPPSTLLWSDGGNNSLENGENNSPYFADAWIGAGN